MNIVVYTLRRPSSNSYATLSFRSLNHQVLCMWFHRCRKALFYWQQSQDTLIAVQILSTHFVGCPIVCDVQLQSQSFLFLDRLIGESVLLIVVTFYSNVGISPSLRVSTNEAFPSVFICSAVGLPQSYHWIAFWFSAVLVVEGIFLVLALWQAWMHRPSNGGVGLMHRLTRESVFYFSLIFWIYVVNLIIWYNKNLLITDLVSTLGSSLPCIVVVRLMIHMRSARYGAAPGSLIDTYLPGIQFTSRPVTRDNEGTTVVSRI